MKTASTVIYSILCLIIFDCFSPETHGEKSGGVTKVFRTNLPGTVNGSVRRVDAGMFHRVRGGAAVRASPLSRIHPLGTRAVCSNSVRTEAMDQQADVAVPKNVFTYLCSPGALPALLPLNVIALWWITIRAEDGVEFSLMKNVDERVQRGPSQVHVVCRGNADEAFVPQVLLCTQLHRYIHPVTTTVFLTLSICNMYFSLRLSIAT